jgi:hypothetical protein
MAPEIVVVPTPSTVRFVFVPETPPDIVNVEPESTCTSVAAPKVIAPDHSLELAVLRSAPPVEIPVPEIVNGSAIVTFPDTVTDAPLVTDVAADVEPSAFEFDTATDPALMVVAPL